MNIFYLSKNPLAAARMHCDKHVVKMILESTQLLSTAHHVLDDSDSSISQQVLKPTHVKHPSAVWVREDKANYQWLHYLVCGLLTEYTHRYNKSHALTDMIRSVLIYEPVNIPRNLTVHTAPPLAMPKTLITIINAITTANYSEHDRAVIAYRIYYRTYKSHILNYTNRTKPFWLEQLASTSEVRDSISEVLNHSIN